MVEACGIEGAAGPEMVTGFAPWTVFGGPSEGSVAFAESAPLGTVPEGPVWTCTVGTYGRTGDDGTDFPFGLSLTSVNLDSVPSATSDGSWTISCASLI